VCNRVADRTGLSTPVKRGPDLIGIAGAGAYPVRPALITKDQGSRINPIYPYAGSPGGSEASSIAGLSGGSGPVTSPKLAPSIGSQTLLREPCSWSDLQHHHSGRLLLSWASTWGNRESESPHRSDSVGAGVEPTAALPIMMVPRGYRAIARAWVLETGG